MNEFLTLYRKEWQAHRMVAGILLVATIGLCLYALSGIVGETSPRVVFVGLPYASALGLPFLLIHTISTEWTGRTHHQMLALPVERSIVLLSKVAFVLSLGAILWVTCTLTLQTIGTRLIEGHIQTNGHLWSPPEVTAGTVWAMSGVVYGIALLPLLGIACAASGVRVMATRFKGLATFGVFIAGAYLYSELRDVLIGPIVSVVGEWIIDFGMPGQGPTTSEAHALLIYSVIFALIGIGAGAALFEKYVEA